MLRKIISGGQTGADRARLDFAIETGLQHGGYVPRAVRQRTGDEPGGTLREATAGESCRIDAGNCTEGLMLLIAFSTLFIPTNPFAIIGSGHHKS